MKFNVEKVTMSSIDIIKDSFRYALSDFWPIFILGLILTITSYLSSNFHKTSLSFSFFMVVVVAILSLLEMGYSFKIIEETVFGSIRPPLFWNFKELFIHGLKDLVLYGVYGILIIFVVYIAIINMFIYPDYYYLFIGLALIFGNLFLMLLMGALLNLAYHDSKLIAGFNLFQIVSLLMKIDLFKLVLVSILSMLIEILITSSLLDVKLICSNEIVSFILNFFITPFLVIFSERTFGLSGKFSN